MIQLIAYTQAETEFDGSQVYLDIDSDEQISFNYTAREISNFDSAQGNFSQSFRLPFTDTNNDFFEHNYNVNTQAGNFSIYQKTFCEVIVDGLPVLKGYLYLTSIELKSKSYSLTIIGEVGTLKEAISDKKLDDLSESWSNLFRHDLTYDNIIDSWDFAMSYSTTPPITSGVIYPFINYGIRNKAWQYGGSTTNSITSNDAALEPDELKPAFQVKALLERIILEAGYKIESNWIDNNGFDFNKIYMNLSRSEGKVKFRPANLGFRAGLSSQQGITVNTPVKIQFDDDSSTGFYDFTANYNTTLYQYTAPKTGTYEVKMELGVRFGAIVGETSADYLFSLYVNNALYSNSPTYNLTTTAGNSTGRNHKLFFPMNLDASDVIDLRITAQNNSGGGALTDFEIQRTTFEFGTSNWQLTSQPNTPELETIYIQDNFPDITQLDFLKSIFKQFNLFVEPKQNDPKTLKIEPYPDYIDEGEVKDWTNKLDLDKELVIMPMTQFRKKDFKLEWAKGENYAARYAQEFRNVPYGGFHYEDESDLLEGEFLNDTIFGEPTNRLIKHAENTAIRDYCVMDLTGRDEDGSIIPLKGKPRIFFFTKQTVGTEDNDFYRLVDPSTGSANEINSYGLASHLSDLPSTTGIFDLNYSANQSPMYNKTIFYDEPTQKDVFNTFYKRYFNEIYQPDARMLVGYFHLTPLDIHNLRFNDKIFVKDCFYRINKVSGYKPNDNTPTKVELIKLFDSTAGIGNNCSLEVSGLAKDGTVSFANGQGVDETPTKECCEAYGYTWVAGESTSDCYWRLFSDPDNPFEPPSDQFT